VLLDLSLPDSSGLETIQRIHSSAPHMPVVVLSGDCDEAVAIAAVLAGAQDYLVKGHITPHLLRRALRFAGHRKQIEQNLVREANHDDLTGLPTRNLLLDRLEQALLGCERSDARGALLFIDLDNFKDINDHYGHKAGDDVLMAIAERMQQAVRATDTVARLGGDEFVVLLPAIDRCDDIGIISQRIEAVFARPVTSGDFSLAVGASIGGVVFPEAADSAKDLLKMADSAMYENKAMRRATAPLHLRAA
jgi:diguanylate cyclase (GGDEF)-like protein